MKYITPKYEMSLLEISDIIMSGEKQYSISESKDENGNSVGNVIMTALDIFS